MKLRSDLRLYPLDNDVVVFSEQAQCLFGLNSSAAFIARALQDGFSPAEVAGTLAIEGDTKHKEATRWVDTTIDALRAHGLINNGVGAISKKEDGSTKKTQSALFEKNMPTFAPIRSGIERHYSLLETRAQIRFSERSQTPWVDAAIGHLLAESSEAASVTIDVLGEDTNDGGIVSYIYRDGEPVGTARALNYLGPIVKGVLWNSAVNAHDFFFNLHSGVVEKDGHCILLPAAAGSGKSSLTAALVSSGFCYFSDEVALIEPKTFCVGPVPLALCSKSTGWDVIAQFYPEVLSLPTHERGDGKQVRYLSAPAQSAAGIEPKAEVRHIIFPNYAADASTTLTAIPRIEAIRRMMDECLALRQKLDEDNVEGLVRWISQIGCYELTFSSLEDAVGLVQRLWASSPPSERVGGQADTEAKSTKHDRARSQEG